MGLWRLRVEDRGCRRSVFFGDTEVWFEADCPSPPTLDFAVVAALMPAMRAGADLSVAGPVSRSLLANLAEFQEAWVCWKPQSYRRIGIVADEEVLSSEPGRSGVFAFSGGVDGTFAFLRHFLGKAGQPIKPVAAVLVHGFDVPLIEPAMFATVEASARRMIAGRVPLHVVRTNWKAISQDWNLEFGVGLAACLHLVSFLAPIGVVGACEDYSHLVLPWGSNPVTNHLLSGAMRIHTEGGGFTRSERVAFIADNAPEMAKELRVCWEGPQTGKNCGVCEKCVRTKLNFMAVGCAPLAFDREPTIREVLSLRARNPAQLALLGEILGTAQQRGISARWTIAVRAALALNRIWALPVWLRSQCPPSIRRAVKRLMLRPV